MKYTIFINQRTLSTFAELDVTDGAILDYLLGWINAKKADRLTLNAEEYTRINFRHLINEMPLLKIKSKDCISIRIKKLKKVGLLKTFQARDNTLYVTTTTKCYELFYTPLSAETDRVSDENGQPLSAETDSTNIILYKTNTKTTTTNKPVVVPGDKKDKDPFREIAAVIVGTPLEGLIPKSAITTLIAGYNPQAHSAHQPETNIEGIKRLIRWTATQMSATTKPIEKPVAFLISRAKEGMDKPQAIILAEQAAETQKREAQERQKRRRETEALKQEREIPADARDALDRLLGRVEAA